MRRSVEISEGEPYYKAELACMLGLIGERAEAERIIADLEVHSASTNLDEARLARALIGVGRTDEAFDHLEKAFWERSSAILYFRHLPGTSQVLKDPRWISLEERIGLPKI
jgi:Flp pilus assembly protein TadD